MGSGVWVWVSAACGDRRLEIGEAVRCVASSTGTGSGSGNGKQEASGGQQQQQQERYASVQQSLRLRDGTVPRKANASGKCGSSFDSCLSWIGTRMKLVSGTCGDCGHSNDTFTTCVMRSRCTGHNEH